jgi:hypothetical protein
MLCDPRRYGVIDIRVWQLLHAVGAVAKKSSGIGLNFNNWYQFLMIIRYFSKKFGVTARNVERTLFLAHKQYQRVAFIRSNLRLSNSLAREPPKHVSQWRQWHSGCSE